MSRMIDLRYDCGHTVRGPAHLADAIAGNDCPTCRWAFRRPVPMPLEEARRLSQATLRPDRWAQLHPHGVANYLLGIGVLCVLEQAHPQALCWWEQMLRIDLAQEQVYDALLECAAGNRWRASDADTKHLAYMGVGRRKPAAYIAPARAVLAEMSPEQRRAELLCTVDLGAPVRLQFPRGWGGKSLCWSLQTVVPGTMKTGTSPFPAALSAWHAALIGESRLWLENGLGATEFQRSPGWVRGTRDNYLGWWRLPAWDEPLEIRRCRKFFRPRGRHSGTSWYRWRQAIDPTPWLRFQIQPGPGMTYMIFGPVRDREEAPCSTTT